MATQVPSPTRSSGRRSPFGAFGSSASAGSSAPGAPGALSSGGGPLNIWTGGHGVGGRDGIALPIGEANSDRAAVPDHCGAAAGGRSSVRSLSFSPARNPAVRFSIRRRSEGIPPRPPSKLGSFDPSAPPSLVRRASPSAFGSDGRQQHAARDSHDARRQLMFGADRQTGAAEAAWRSGGGSKGMAPAIAYGDGGLWPNGSAPGPDTPPTAPTSPAAHHSDLSPLSSDGLSPVSDGSNRNQ